MQILLKIQRMGNFFHRNKIPVLPKLIYYLNYLLFNSSVPSEVKIGKGSKFSYGGIGLVIHQRTVIGENCTIGQGITIGGRSKEYEVPIIGDSVYMGAGCRILGPINIGDNVIIAPNSVVLKDIPSNSMVAGIPAIIKKSGITISDYI